MNEELIAEAILGRDVEDFLNSEVGKYLVGCAEQEANEAMNELKKIATWRKRRIAELQNKIWRAESFQRWLGELIIGGRQAIQQLDEE